MAKSMHGATWPKCGMGYLVTIGERAGGFSAGKAAIGAVISAPIGLAAGVLDKRV